VRGSQSGGARGPSERADSAAPALARGVPSVCWGVWSLRGLLVSNPSSRSPLGPWFGDAPQRVAVVLVPSAHDASCRASVAAASAFGAITPVAGVASEPPGDDQRRRSLWKARVYTRGFWSGKTTGNGAWERVVSQKFAPTDQFGVQIDLTPGSQSKSEMPYCPPS